jgi:hypothetical protein
MTKVAEAGSSLRSVFHHEEREETRSSGTTDYTDFHRFSQSQKTVSFVFSIQPILQI